MNKEQWINSISNEELAFRMYGKDYFRRTCLECVFFKADGHSHWKCIEPNYEAECERQYQEWLEEEME